MKNSTIFPFERNRYFYGKLLSVDDFELEQKYHNDKRRMLNQFLNGAGVIAGMHVVMVDEQTISVETGCALDAWGREIAVEIPVVRKLSLLEGFENCEDLQDECAYLCIEYDEKENSPVHNIAGNVGVGAAYESSVQNSRVREGYRLYLTNRRPENRDLSYESLYQETREIYGGRGVTIVQTCPKYVRSGDTVEISVTVENLGQQYISFSYILDLDRLTWEGKSQLEISFDEMMLEKTGSYTLNYTLKAAEVSGVEAGLSLNEGSFRLYVSRKLQETSVKFKSSSIVLTEVDACQELIRRYYRTAMERQMAFVGSEPIYLSKIYMTKAGDSYMIDRVENLPYRQMVSSNYLNAALIQMMLQGNMGKRPFYSEEAGVYKMGGQENFGGIQVRNGVAMFDLSQGGVRGLRVYSDEIFHGLGFGRVTIQTGLVEEDGCVTYGSPAVFSKQRFRVETAARTFEERGSFVIGIRLLETVTEGTVLVRWTAVKDADEDREDKVEKRIFIKPGLLDLGLRESFFLEATCVNMADRRVLWSVKEGGGSIDEAGVYTAPNIPGVYEVTARSAAYPEVKASIFVVVRDGGKE